MNTNVTCSQLYEEMREMLNDLEVIPPEVKEKIRWIIEGAKLVVESESKPA